MSGPSRKDAEPASCQAFRSPRTWPAADPADIFTFPRPSASLLDSHATFPFARPGAYTHGVSVERRGDSLHATLDRLVLAHRTTFPPPTLGFPQPRRAQGQGRSQVRGALSPSLLLYVRTTATSPRLRRHRNTPRLPSISRQPSRRRRRDKRKSSPRSSRWNSTRLYPRPCLRMESRTARPPPRLACGSLGPTLRV